jgi:hypothetical protein
MGNFATYGRFHLAGPTALGMILQVTMDAHGRFLRGKILPTELTGKGVPRPDPKGRVIDLVRTLTQSDFPATGVIVARDGTITAPPVAAVAHDRTPPHPRAAPHPGKAGASRTRATAAGARATVTRMR